MFNSDKDGHNMVSVALKLITGEIEKGQVHGGMTGKLADALNKPCPFVELVGPDGSVALIAKTSISRIEPVVVPKVNQLSKRLEGDGIPEPHKVLGIDASASQDDIQDAYHGLAKQYHPDNFSGQEVPKEVLDYVSAMFTRITTAYNELKTGLEHSDAA